MLTVMPHAIAFVVAAAVGTYAWRFRQEPGGTPCVYVTLGQALCMAGYIAELASTGIEAKAFWDTAQYFADALWVAGLMGLAVEFTGLRLARPNRLYVGVAMPIILFALFSIALPFHPWIRENTRLIPGGFSQLLMYDFPPLTSVLVYYIMILYGSVALQMIHSTLWGQPLYRVQAALLSLGTVIPVIGIILSATVLVDSPDRDLSPYAIILSNICIGLGLFHYRLFELVPLGRSMVIENLPDPVLVLDHQDRILDLNAAADDFLGTGIPNKVGKAVEETAGHMPELARVCGDRQEAHSELCLEGETPRYLAIRSSVLLDARKRFRGRVLLIRDVTEQRLAEMELRDHRDNLERLVRDRSAQLEAANDKLMAEIAERERVEEQFRQAEKMEAVGRLAGGVAHDFNNLLTSIMGHAELLLFSVGGNQQQREYAETIRDVAQRAADLTRQLLAFSRKQVLQPKDLDLNDLLDGIQKMLRRLVREDITFHVKMATGLGVVRADPVQIQQVIMNLVVNARDAMPSGGELTIHTANLEVNEYYADQHVDIVPGRYVTVEVCDTGIGMTREIMEHIFEPFFTTKELGQGTGLGLATVHGIIKQSNGFIQVYSEPNVGTRFRILFPRVADMLEEGDYDGFTEPIRGANPGERILVVEDEKFVLELIKQILTEAGYEVMTAGDAFAATELVRTGHERIDLLLTDVVMPGGKTGRDLALELKARRKDLRVLFMSGYSEDIIARHGVLEEGVNFVEKPFSRRQLLIRVRDVLDAPVQDQVV